jgi:hypothetical protein
MGRALGLGAILSAAFSKPAAASLRMVVKWLIFAKMFEKKRERKAGK